MVERGQQRVGIRWQIDADHVGLLVDDVVDETGVLVGEAIVVLPPDVRAEQVVQAGDGATPLELVGDLQPLGVLVDHGVDDVDERLVRRHQPVATRQQVPLQPALALVLTEHFHDLPAAGHVLVHLGRLVLRQPLLVRLVVHTLETVRRRLVGPEDAEVGVVVPHHSRQPRAQLARALRDRSTRVGDVDGEVPEVGQPQFLAQHSPVGLRQLPHPQPDGRCQLGDVLARGAGVVEQLLRLVGGEPVVEVLQVLIGVAGIGQRHLVAAPTALGLVTVDLLRPGPTLGGVEDDHGPAGTLGIVLALIARPNPSLFIFDDIDQLRSLRARKQVLLALRRLSREWHGTNDNAEAGLSCIAVTSNSDIDGICDHFISVTSDEYDAAHSDESVVTAQIEMNQEAQS